MTMNFKDSMIPTIARKEFLHIIHDPRTLMILFLMPVLQLIMFGYALRLEIQNVHIAVIDYSKSKDSRELIDQFKGSAFFHPFFFDGPVDKINDLFKARKARVALIIPQDFDKQLLRDTAVPLQFIIDASDANAATAIRNYCSRVVNDFNVSYNRKIPLPFDIRSSVLFNPDTKSTYFFVPGLVALLLIMISALLTSITITREKETGTMEQILVSPVRPFQIILGKVLPYIFLAFIIGIIILLIGIFLFSVPFEGSVWLLMLLSTLYIITALSLGLMISTIAKTQQIAMMIALITTLLPTIMLSGFIFPIASMPKVLQYISYIIPARFYLLIVRGIILKGSTFMELLQPTLFLAGMSFILLNVAVRKFSTNLEK
ncbi:MAG: ABC transporter permease [Calditrichia bacterium]